MTTEEERMEKIKEIILKHKGKANAIKSKTIAAMIGINEDDTHIGTRSLITKLVKQGLPIGACDNGYFIMETQEEVDDYQQILNNRIDEIWERKRHIQDNFCKYHGKKIKPKTKPETEEDKDEDIL
jgi:hypothetical protein